jgi:hypothetical protein
VILTVALTSAAAPAQTFSAAGDFSTSSNSGTWTYGTMPSNSLGTGAMTLLTGSFSNYIGSVSGWVPTGGTSITVPCVTKNLSGTAVNNGSGQWEGNQLAVHPNDGVAIVVRFTAPTSNTYDLSASFINQSFDNYAGQQVSIYRNGTPIKTAEALGVYGQSSTPFNTQLAISAGDIVDFYVAPRLNGTANSTLTGINATFTPTPVPEPTGLLAALGFGAAILGGFRLRLPRRPVAA